MILVPYYKPRGQNEHVFKDTNASTSNRVFGCFGTDPFLFAGYQIAGTERRMNAQFVRPAAIELGLVTEEERFGWHRFRHSLSTWANDTTKDITVSQTMLHHSKPDITAAVYTHGNFGKALDAQRICVEQLLRMKPASESTQ